jgi:hypothetical protein
MPSIESIQKKNLSFLSTTGSNKNDFINFEAGKNIFHKYAQAFVKELEKNIRKYNVTASGKLIDSIEYEVSEDGKVMRVYMADYYDYPNKGVKGVKSSRNAPLSPYRFKNYGMNADGRKSIRDYISSGRAKITTVAKDRALGIGGEKKGVSLLDTQTDTLIYLIKKYGIKTTNYFDEAVNTVFRGFADDLANALADGNNN